MTPRSQTFLARRAWYVIVAACIGIVTTIFVINAPSSPVSAVAGTPGAPGAPTVIWTEDFENNGSLTVNPPAVITDYVGADGMTYSVSPFWSSAVKCNGIVVSQTSAPATANSTLCANSNSVWNKLRILSAKLTNNFGKPGDLFTVASYTAGSDGVAPDDYVQLQTNTPVSLPPGGAFLTTSLDSGAYNCFASGPNYFMYLTDASGVRSQVVSNGINPCTDPDRILDPSIDGQSAAIVRTVGDAPALIDSASVVLTVENHNVGGRGNDATFDNLTLIDVSPQLDKEFETPVPYGSTSTITFTITNTYSPSGDGSLTRLDPKAGWSFSDQLPAGLQMVGSPTTGAGAEACANLNTTGSNAGTVSVKADLSSGQAYCTVLVEVEAVAPGTYTNLASDVTLGGLGGPLDASVTFTSAPSISLTKSSRVNDANTDGVTNAGDTISYSFIATNTGNIPLTDVAVTDPLVGAVTCSPTSIPVGGSVPCTATAVHTITLADMNAGKVDNTATVVGTDYFTPSVTVTDADTISTPLNAAPVLTLVKAAGTPVDVNNSGLVDAGDTIAYTFTITNDGNVTMNLFRVTDPLVGSVTCPVVTLAPGQATTCTADNLYVVQVGDESAGAVTNTATAYGSTPAGVEVPSNTDSTTSSVATPAPSLSIVKTADVPVDVNASGLTDAGDTIQYRFTVTNDGNVPMASIAVSDPLAGSVTCADTSLIVGASTTCTADAVYVITAADETVGIVVNSATASGRDPDNTLISSEPDDTSTAVSTPAPALTLVKTADAPVDVNNSDLVDAGDTIRYRFTVTNAGNVPISNIVINDPLAGAATCVSTTLAVGASTTCVADAVYVITAADETAGLVDNVASVSGTDPDNGAVTSPDDQVATAVDTPAPSLVINKSADVPVDVNGSGLVDAGDTIQYRFTVANNGNVPLSSIVVDDPLAGAVTCLATSLAVGASTTCTADAVYVVTEANETAGLVENTATVAGRDPDNELVTSNEANAVTAVQTPAPALTFDKVADAPVDVNASGLTDAGDTIQYRFTVTNSGNVPISDLVVNDALAGAATCLATSLAVGASTTCTADAVYTISEADETSHVVTNTASASASDPDGGAVTSNSDTTTTPVDTPDPSLLFDKTADTPVDVNVSGLTDTGDTIQFRFTVTNNGNVPLANIAINDALVGAVTCVDTSLAVGASTTCTADAVYTIADSDEVAGEVQNTAFASATDPDSGSVMSAPDTTVTLVATPDPMLTVDKTADVPTDVNSSGLVDTGDTILFRFTVSNTGNVPVSSIVVNDPMAGAVTCAATTLAVGASTTCVADAVYTITAADEVAGLVQNTATAAGVDPDNGAVESEPDSTVTAVITPRPSLVIDKTADTPTDTNASGITDTGDTIQYRFVVTNNGNVPITEVAVADPLVGAVNCVDAALAVGASTTCVAASAYTISSVDESEGVVINVATASGLDPDNGPVISNEDTTATPVTTPNPALSFDKLAATPVDVNASGITDAGDTIRFSFTVTNTGNVPVANIAVVDDLVGAVTCASTLLAPGAQTDCVAVNDYVVTADDETAGIVENVASAAGVDPDGGAVASNSDSTATAVTLPGPSLILVKTADPAVDVNSSGITDAGDTIQYRFTVTNNGNVPVTGVAIDDPLAGAATCEVTTLSVGGSTTCVADAVYAITADDVTAGRVVNVATATALDPDGGTVTSPPDDTTTSVTTPRPSLLLAKTADAPADVNASGLADAGDTIQYRFVVTNNGNVPISTITIDDPLAGVATCADTVLAVDASTACTADAVYTITDDDEAAGKVVNVATAAGIDPAGLDVISDPDDTTTVVETPAPSLAFVKTADTPVDVNASGITDAGDTIQYRFMVTNTGNVPVAEVVVNDPLVGAVTCTATVLAVGEATTCLADGVYTITADDETAQQVVNTATATGADPDGGAVTSPEATTSTPVETPAPSIVIVKSADLPTDVNASGITDAGDTIQYRFTVTNNGNVPVSDIVVNDPLVGAVTCESTALAVDANTTCAADAPYVVTEANEDAGLVNNVATAAAVDPDDGAVESGTSNVSVPVTKPDPSLVIVKTADAPVDVNSSGLTDAGDTIQFRFTVTNTGNVPIATVAVDDPLAGTVTCEATELAVDATTNCVADSPYVITEANETAGLVVNVASAAGADPDGGAVESNTDSSATPVMTPSPALAIVKTADAAVDVNSSGLTDAGDTVQYRFTVTNTGDVPVTAVSVVDPLAGSVTCDQTALAVGASTSCVADAVYTITETDESAGVVLNVASAMGADPDGDEVRSPTASAATPVATPAPALAVDKTADNPVDVNVSGLTDAGDTVQYRFTVTNTGNVPVTDVAINDPLVGTATCAATELAVGESTLCVADAVYTIDADDETTGAVVNTAWASGSDPDGGTVVSKIDRTSTPVATPAPGLKVDKTADPAIDVNASGLTDAGDTVQYRFTVTNTGNVPVTAIVVTDPLAGAVTCDETSLPVGAATDCVANTTYTITSADVIAGFVLNVASAAGVDPDGDPVTSDPDDTTTPVAAPRPSLVVIKSADTAVDVNVSGLVDAGDTIQYRFTVTNNGNVPLTAVVIDDPMVGTVTCAATVLAVNATTTCVADSVYTITAADETGGQVVNTATATGIDPDRGEVESAPATTATAVATPRPNLVIDKFGDDPVDVNVSGLADAGDTIQYYFTVTNTGNVPVVDVVVNDPVLGTVTCEATVLAVNASTSCIADTLYTVTPNDGIAGRVVNVASASGVDPDGDAVTSRDARWVTPVVVARPLLTIDKTADAPTDVNTSGTVDAGDTIQYRFTVTNSGNVPVTGLVVDDPLVGAVTCEGTALAVGASTICLADAVYVITADDEAAGKVVNSARAVGADPDGVAVKSMPDTVTQPVVASRPSLVIVKSADAAIDVNGSGLIDAGDTIQYRFTVTNNGNVPVADVVVNDPMAGAVTCEATALAVGQSTDCVADAVYVLTANNEAAGLVVNRASSTAVASNGAQVVSNIDTAATPVATPRPSLLLVKTADDPVDTNGSGVTDVGDTIQYRFTVTNNGNVPLAEIVVNDPLAGAVTCDATTLAVGESVDCVADAPYTINVDDIANGSVTNVASATGVDPDGGETVSNSDKTVTVVMTPRPSLLIDKSAETPLDVNKSGITDAGDTVQYRFTVTNDGNVPISGVVVNDPMIGAVTCEATELDPGASTACSADSVLVITSDDEVRGVVLNTASASGVDPGGDAISSASDETYTNVVRPQPFVSMTKLATNRDNVVSQGPFQPGDPVKFVFDVTNNGNVIVNELSVSDPMLGSVSCPTSRLAPGETTRCAGDATYTLTEFDLSNGSLTNVATANVTAPNGSGSQALSSTDSVTVTVVEPNGTIPSTGGAPLRALAWAFAALGAGFVLWGATRRFRRT